MNKGGQIHIGTSGWLYGPWRGPFYPEDIRTEDLLPFYARTFSTVEINNSFYRAPTPKTIQTWCGRVPEEFVFSVKANRYLTHRKLLKGNREDFDFFFSLLPVFGQKLGPVLYQLPPRFHKNAERLAAFLALLPADCRATFEFRHESWFDEDIYAVLRKHNAAWCIYDLDRRHAPAQITADFAYLRMHGPQGPYKGSYDDAFLQRWARQFLAWQKEDIDVYCYFDNDEKGYAVKDAHRLCHYVELSSNRRRSA
ncbi:MAG TPA: DUF72 domain-containing protein [Dongiaceae bacterium]|jgi:uncharacterized protein YecE (DUF72 family)|nr:DUF72 domain-containing protein [Dongiaceae bacterium]